MCSKKKEERIKSEILNQNFRFLFTKSCFNISIVNKITSIIILYFGKILLIIVLKLLKKKFHSEKMIKTTIKIITLL